MATKPAHIVADAALSRAKWLNWYTTRMSKRGLPVADLNQVYGGAFVSFYAFYERQIEKAFLGLASGGLTHPRLTVAPLVSFSSSDVMRQVIFGGRKYVDWLPFDQHTKARAKLFLRDGQPFSDLARSDIDVLDGMGTLRNAIAHQSKHSLTQFDKTFVAGKSLPTDQRNPAGYLRGSHSLGTTRLEFVFSQAIVVLDKICR